MFTLPIEPNQLECVDIDVILSGINLNLLTL